MCRNKLHCMPNMKDVSHSCRFFFSFVNVFTVLLVNDCIKPVHIEDFGAHVQRMHTGEDKRFELEYNVSKKKQLEQLLYVTKISYLVITS